MFWIGLKNEIERVKKKAKKIKSNMVWIKKYISEKL